MITNCSFACSCIEINSVKKEVDKSHAIFTGKVLSVKLISESHGKGNAKLTLDSKIYRIKITSMHKGRLKPEIVEVISRTNTCEYEFDVGQNYIIYATVSKTKISSKIQNRLNTSICTRTRLFDQKEFDQLVNYCKIKGYS